ncbi:MAG: FecR family protein [Prolixibacteraceae bacterium]|jgi:ferric-dicitrate binding protein FerR (iron transport regulator)
MKNNEHQLDKLIDNYLKDKSSTDEHDALDLFAESFRKELGWEEEQMGNKDEIASGIWQKVTQYRIQSRRKTIRYRKIGLGISVAASLTLIVGLSFWFQKPVPDTQLFSMETETKMDSLFLPDGSVLFLSPGTKVNYDQNFNRKTREIELVKGNAFFKVARNPQKPFIITSGAIKTKVLGTSFNIHMGIDGLRVTVHTGKVNVFSDSESVNLVPLQEASYSMANAHLSISTVSLAAISQWYNSDITLADQNLKTILDLVDQKYGLETIRVEQKLLDLRATVFIAREATLESILQQINYITNLKLEVHGKEISCRNQVGETFDSKEPANTE